MKREKTGISNIPDTPKDPGPETGFLRTLLGRRFLIRSQTRQVVFRGDLCRYAPGIHKGPGNLGLYQEFFPPPYFLGKDTAYRALPDRPGFDQEFIVRQGGSFVVYLHTGYIDPVTSFYHSGIVKTHVFKKFVAAVLQVVQIVSVVHMTVTVTFVGANLQAALRYHEPIVPPGVLFVKRGAAPEGRYKPISCIKTNAADA
jgi:hypothetical protein